MQLLDAEIRDVSASDFEERWREELGPVPEAEALTFASSLFGAGAPVAVELSHPDPDQLDRIGQRVVAELRQFDGVAATEPLSGAGNNGNLAVISYGHWMYSSVFV